MPRQQRPICDACKHEVTDSYYQDGLYEGTHCDVCYRLVLLHIIAPDGKRLPYSTFDAVVDRLGGDDAA